LAKWDSVNDHLALAALGFAGKHPGTATKVSYIFDTMTQTFKSLPDLPLVRASGSTFLERAPDNMVYFLHYAGGLADRNTDVATHYVLELHREGTGNTQTFEPVGDWIESVPMEMARNHAGTVAIGTRVYVAGGQFGHDAVRMLDSIPRIFLS